MTIVTGASVETMEDTGESVTIELGGATRAHRWLIDRMSLVEIADAEALHWVAIMMIWRVTYFPAIEHCGWSGGAP